MRENGSKRIGMLLVGCALAASGGCGSAEPVVTDESRAVQLQEVQAQTQANDAASKAASRPRSGVGVMPP